MKARIIRYIFATHRWAGVILGLLMLLWCLSGFVMIWSPYPSLTLGTHDYRVEGMAPLKPPEQLAFPDVPDDASITMARMEMSGETPVINLAWRTGVEDGGQTGRDGGLFRLTTGEKITSASEADALSVAGVYADRLGIKAAPSIKTQSVYDEFTIQGFLRGGAPYYQVRLNDAEQTMLYISSKTGVIAQRTTASLRFWTWAGAIPHWLYFTEIRKDGQVWNNVVIYTSLAGCFLTITGLFVGIRQYRRRHSTGKRASPYRGFQFWHHMLGLVFGVLVLTWTFSGFTSMQPWGWLESGSKASEAVERITGDPPTWAQLRPALEEQAALLRNEPREVSQVTFSQLRGGSGFVWRFADGARERIGPTGAPAPFDEAEQKRIAALLAGEGAAFDVELMTKPDAYYYPGAAASDLPVVRITVPSLENANFYLDPVTAGVRFVADAGARDFRWWHLALHRLDILPPPLREIVVLLLMLGVTAVCAAGVWLGARKLARGGKLDNLPKDEPSSPAS